MIVRPWPHGTMLSAVFPAKAGIHPQCRLDATLEMDPRLRGDDRIFAGKTELEVKHASFNLNVVSLGLGPTTNPHAWQSSLNQSIISPNLLQLVLIWTN